MPANQLDELHPLFAQARRTLASAPAFSGQLAWPEKVAVAPTSQALLPPKVDSAVLVVVHEAVYMGRQLRLEYAGRGQAESKRYTVHALGLIQRGPVSYLAARINDYPDVRLLALHRIRRAERLPSKSVAPKGFRIETLIPDVAAGFDRGKPIHLVLRMADHAALHLWETPLSVDQSISSVGSDGFVKLKATVEDTAQLRWWLLGFGDYVEVLRPVALARELRAIHARAANPHVAVLSRRH